MALVAVIIDGSTITPIPRNNPAKDPGSITVNPKTFVNFRVSNTGAAAEDFSITHPTTKKGDNVTLHIPHDNEWTLVIDGATSTPMTLTGAKEGTQTITYDGNPLSSGPVTASTFVIKNESDDSVSIMISASVAGNGESTVGIQSPTAGNQKTLDLAIPPDDPIFVIKSKQSGDDR